MRGVLQLERPKRKVHVVAGHVAQGSLAEIPPAPPLSRMVDARPEGTFGRGAEPKIPTERLWWRLASFRALPAAPTLADPDVNLRDFADRARLDDLDDAPIVFAGVNLRPQLRRHAMFASRFRHDPRFGDGVRQRLFAIDVKACADRSNRRRSVMVVGRRNHHGVDLAFLLFQHLTVVGIRSGAGKASSRALQIVSVDVDQGDNILMRNRLNVRRCLVGRPDTSDMKLLIGRFRIGSSCPRPDATCQKSGRSGCLLEKTTAGELGRARHDRFLFHQRLLGGSMGQERKASDTRRLRPRPIIVGAMDDL